MSESLFSFFSSVITVFGVIALAFSAVDAIHQVVYSIKLPKLEDDDRNRTD